MAKKNAPVANTPAVEPAPAPAPTPSSRLGLGLCGLPPMRRMDFQDALLEANREMRLDDHRLTILMNVEHPGMLPLTVDYIPGIRRLYNAGKHTKHQVRPATPVPEFDTEGREVAGRKRKAEPTAEPLTAEDLGATGTGD